MVTLGMYAYSAMFAGGGGEVVVDRGESFDGGWFSVGVVGTGV